MLLPERYDFTQASIYYNYFRNQWNYKDFSKSTCIQIVRKHTTNSSESPTQVLVYLCFVAVEKVHTKSAQVSLTVFDSELHVLYFYIKIVTVTY